MRFVKDEVIEFIKYFEGYSPIAYNCPTGYATIGYGHLLAANDNLVQITKPEAEELLIADIKHACAAVLRNIHVPLSDNQYGALVSFTFNLGGGALQRSTLRQKVNNHENKAAAHEFKKWVWAGGKKLPGLIKRRKLESRLYIGTLSLAGS